MSESERIICLSLAHLLITRRNCATDMIMILFCVVLILVVVVVDLLALLLSLDSLCFSHAYEL